MHYRLVRENLFNTLNGYVQEVCPVARPLKKESQKLAKTISEQVGAHRKPARDK